MAPDNTRALMFASPCRTAEQRFERVAIIAGHNSIDNSRLPDILGSGAQSRGQIQQNLADAAHQKDF
jgi:hypothetical protein